MIRRISCVIFLLLYLTTTAGFALNIHYCGSTIASVKIDQKAEKKCCKEAASKPDKCCKNKHVNVKVTDQHKASPEYKSQEIFPLSLFLDGDFARSFFHPTWNRIKQSFVKEPPTTSKIATNVKNCTFRI